MHIFHWLKRSIVLVFLFVFTIVYGDDSFAEPDTVVGQGVDQAAVHDSSDWGYEGNVPTTIYDIVASPAYFPSNPNPEQTKFVVMLNNDGIELDPTEIAAITITGPGQYRFGFLNQPYARPPFNGYFYDPRQNSLWYQAYALGFPPNGYYTIEVRFVNGSRAWQSREVEINYPLLDSFLRYQDALSFYPSDGGAVSGSALLLLWTTLKDFGGPDAYYNSWLVGGPGVGLSDSIFLWSQKSPDAGLNNNWSLKGRPQLPLPPGEYTWFVELLDSNVLSEINLVVFFPWQEVYVY